MTDLEITGRGLLVAHDWLLEREGEDAAANFLRALIQGKKWMLQGYLVRRLHGTGAGLQTVVMRVHRTRLVASRPTNSWMSPKTMATVNQLTPSRRRPYPINPTPTR